MQTKIIYEEKIVPIIEILVFSIVIIVIIHQIFIVYPAINWSYLIALLVLILVLIVIIYAFRKFNIEMTSDAVIVKYGFGKRTILWENIADCYLDKTSVIWYGGWGLRIGRVDKKWRNVYNVFNYPRVVISLKDGGFYKEFVFSTNNPKEVIKIVKQQMD